MLASGNPCVDKLCSTTMEWSFTNREDESAATACSTTPTIPLLRHGPGIVTSSFCLGHNKPAVQVEGLVVQRTRLSSHPESRVDRAAILR